jgi:hypothetical protein
MFLAESRFERRRRDGAEAGMKSRLLCFSSSAEGKRRCRFAAGARWTRISSRKILVTESLSLHDCDSSQQFYGDAPIRGAFAMAIKREAWGDGDNQKVFPA